MSVKGAVMVPHPPLIVPEIGRGEERKIQATVDAYHQAARKIAQWKPDTVVVISPHSVMYADYFHISPGKGTTGNFARFREITGWSGSACPVCLWPYIMNWDSASGRRRNFWTGVLRSSEAAICPIS